MMVLSRASRLALGVLALFLATPASAQENLDHGKTPAQLFANNCVVCHKKPQGLAKPGTSGLDIFLLQHYSASRETAATLAVYLQSMSPPPGGKKLKGEEGTKTGEKKLAVKPAGTKSGEAKPGEAKPGEAKPGEANPSDSKPAESKPAESKPAESKPSEPKPSVAKPAKTKPAEAKPAEAKPTEAKPNEPKPAQPPKSQKPDQGPG